MVHFSVLGKSSTMGKYEQATDVLSADYGGAAAASLCDVGRDGRY
jgi:hypothetical protein